MNESLFVSFKDWFKSIAKTIEEKVNGKKTELTYLYKTMLTEELTTDLTWNSLTVNTTIVTADVVAMDSALPLKKRDLIAAASGSVPKIGMKMYLTERQMSDIDILRSRNAETKVIVDKIFQDTVKCTMGIHEKLEFMFLQGLSSGVTLVDDDTNVGTGIRVDYGYLPGNKFGAVVPWSNIATAKPIDDIKRIIKYAKTRGDNPTFLMMDETTFDNLAQNQQTREQYAFQQNFVGTQIPVPDLDQVNTMMRSRYKLTIIIVDRTVITERDGARTVQTPWEPNRVIFLNSLKVGKTQYGILAEETRKSPKVLYEKSGSFILLKKWSSEEPFSEFTSSQALVIPVIDNVSSIYSLDSEEAATDAQVEGNSVFTYLADDYTKASVAAALKLANPKTQLTVNSTDANLLMAINKLSDEQIAIFEASIVAAP